MAEDAIDYELALDGQMRAPAAYVCKIDNDRTRQLPLHAETPLLRVRARLLSSEWR